MGKKKYILTAILGIIIISIIIVLPVIKHDIKGNRNIKRCKLLKIGMNREQVLNVMKIPMDDIHVSKDEDIGVEKWTFDAPYGVSTFPQCSFDIETGRTTEIIWGEWGNGVDGRLVDKEKYLEYRKRLNKKYRK